MPKPPDDRMARALRENLKRRKAGARKAGAGAADDASERRGGEEGDKPPIKSGAAAVPVRPNTAEKKT